LYTKIGTDRKREMPVRGAGRGVTRVGAGRGTRG